MEQFVGTKPVSEQHRFDTEALAAYLRERLPGFDGPLQVEQFKGGQSNPTYKLSTPTQQYVMRSKPGPVARLLPSAHAIEREFRVLSGLKGSAVPVPQMHLLCDDESIIGRAFYIMECVQGRVLWEQHLPGMSPTERGAIYDELNRVMAALHTVDIKAAGLADFGKPGNYFERQISRWSKQYRASETERIEAMDRLIDWLPANIPPMARSDGFASVVHGDYRLDNVMFHPTEPRVLAVLDWELSTIGHPLADFSYHCMSWRIAPGDFRGLGGLNLAELGIPSEAQYIERYCQRTGLAEPQALREEWDFYLAYNMFRLSAILQGIVKRVQAGTAASAQAARSAQGVGALSSLGWQAALRFT